VDKKAAPKEINALGAGSQDLLTFSRRLDADPVLVSAQGGNRGCSGGFIL
jgi:hypothetical protein